MTSHQNINTLRQQLLSLRESLNQKEGECKEWKDRFVAKQGELAKIMGKQSAVIKLLKASGDEEAVLKQKDGQIEQLKLKLLGFKKQIQALQTRKAESKKSPRTRKNKIPAPSPREQMFTRTEKKAPPSPLKKENESTRKLHRGESGRTLKRGDSARKVNRMNRGESSKSLSQDDSTRKSSRMNSTSQLRASADTDGTFTLGDVVDTVDGRRGTVRYIGPLHCAKGVWVGLELPTASGKNNGWVKGKEYFECRRNYGIMVRKTKIKTVASTKLDQDGLEEIELT